jgi:hypothetical protein
VDWSAIDVSVPLATTTTLIPIVVGRPPTVRGAETTAALLLVFSFVVLAIKFRSQRRSGRAWPVDS